MELVFCSSFLWWNSFYIPKGLQLFRISLVTANGMPCSYKKTNCPLYTLRSRAKLNVGGGGGRVDSSLCTSAVTSCVCSMSKKDVEQLVHSIMPKDLLKPPNVNFFSFSKSYGGSSFCVVQCLHQRSISYNTCKFIF